MSRYTGSKVKLSRRVQRNLFLKGARSFSAKDEYTKKNYKPGEHGPNQRFIRLSEYGKHLQEKQALRYSYGVSEKQMTNLFRKAFTTGGQTGNVVLELLERRLDSVVYRAGLANSMSQARQLVNHGHFNINGKKASIPSMLVKVGDLVEVKENKIKRPFWKEFKLEVPQESPAWLEKKDKTIKVINLPLETDLPKDFNMGYLVEYYSRRVR